jgi:hypothetical protein
MSNEKKSIWVVIFEFLASLFSNTSDKRTEDVVNDVRVIANDPDNDLKTRLKNSGETIVDGMAEVAVNEAATQAGGLLIEHGDYLLGLSEVQRAYALQIAYLKAVDDLDTLSFDELKEYRAAASKALELGIDVADEMNSFWTDFGDAVRAVIDVAADVGVKAAATALKVMIPIL